MKIENGQPVYSSFKEYAECNGIKSDTKKKNSKKIAASQEKFASHHKCRACGEVMSYVDSTNIMVCRNPACKGIKYTRKDVDGNEVVTYKSSYDVLADKYADIAKSLFDGRA